VDQLHIGRDTRSPVKVELDHRTSHLSR